MPLPQPGLGGFSHTAGGKKGVAFPVQRHDGAVHDKDILVQELICRLAVTADRFQIAVGEGSRLLLPLFCQFLIGNPDGQLRRKRRFKAPAQPFQIGIAVVKFHRYSAKQAINHVFHPPEISA